MDSRTVWMDGQPIGTMRTNPTRSLWFAVARARDARGDHEGAARARAIARQIGRINSAIRRRRP